MFRQKFPAIKERIAQQKSSLEEINKFINTLKEKMKTEVAEALSSLACRVQTEQKGIQMLIL